MNKTSERGQAIIMIVFAIIGLVGLTALTVDGGRAYMDRRSAQGAADSAAFAAALAHARGEDESLAAMSVVNQNGYDGVTENQITVNVFASPSGACPEGATPNVDIDVEITSNVTTFFAPVIGIPVVTNTVSATTRACGVYSPPIFGGEAIVALGQGTNDCAYDSGQSASAKWIVKGGGIFSNTCIYSKNADSVTLDSGQCASAVGGVTGGLSGKACSGGAPAVYGNDYIASITPPNPCTGAITSGVYAGGGKVVTAGQFVFTDGVYCIDTTAKMNALTKKNVVLTNATLYVTATEFDVKFAGTGGFSGTPTKSGVYSSYYMIIPNTAHPCTTFTGNGSNKQVIEYRGNGSGGLYGTILAPSACIDFRGNPSGEVNSQLVGNMVSSNGTADVTVNYVADQNRREPVSPTISLLK